MDAMKHFTEGMIKENKPQFEVGDTVRVSVRIKEGDKERIQAFEGTVIAKKHGGIAETFTVRRTSYGVGVERVFPVNSPFVEKVDVVRRGKVRRELHPLRDLEQVVFPALQQALHPPGRRPAIRAGSGTADCQQA